MKVYLLVYEEPPEGRKTVSSVHASLATAMDLVENALRSSEHIFWEREKGMYGWRWRSFFATRGDFTNYEIQEFEVLQP